MLIFAPNATDPGRLERLCPQDVPGSITTNVPTWIIGPASGERLLIERSGGRAESLAEPIQRLPPPAQFKSAPRASL